LTERGKGEARIVVVKVGGSVLTGTKAFRRAALFLKHRCDLAPNEKFVVVVSARKRVTDRLEGQARRIVHTPSARALDLLWSTGELLSVALLALYLEALRISSVGLNVHETGLCFSSVNNKDLSMADGHLEEAINKHSVVVVPGFLAIRSTGEIASLGRGGSDLSAVLLAIGLRASRCELVKDVAGYFEADPRANANARHLASLSFDKAMRMANRGCDVVQRRALLAASRANLPLVIRSLDEKAPASTVLSCK
jgi:aspartate kinase